MNDVSVLPYSIKVPDFRWTTECSCGNKIRWGTDDYGRAVLYGARFYSEDHFYSGYGMGFFGHICSTCRSEICPGYIYIDQEEAQRRVNELDQPK